MNARLAMKTALTGFAFTMLVSGTSMAQDSKVALWSFMDPAGEGARSEALKDVLASFESANAGTKVNVNIVEWDQIVPSLMRAAQAGQVPDVALVYSPSLPSLIAAGAVTPLDDCLASIWTAEERSDTVILPVGRSGDKVYGVPYELRVFGYFYRSDLLEKAGIGKPTTFDELVAAAKKASGSDIQGLGMTFNAGGGSVEAIEWFVPTAVGMGARILNEDGSAAFNSPQVIALLERLKKAVQDEKVLPSDVVLSTVDQVSQLAQSGRLAFIAEGSQEASTFNEAATGDMKWAFMPPPGMTAGSSAPAALNGWNLVIPKGAKNPDGACRLIKTWTSLDVQRAQTVKAGYLPVRGSLATDPALQAPETAYMAELLKYALGNPLQFSYPANIDLLNEALSQMIERTVTGQMAPAEAAKAAEESYNSRR